MFSIKGEMHLRTKVDINKKKGIKSLLAWTNLLYS